MNINDILTAPFNGDLEDQKAFFDQMKEQKIFDLEQKEKENLIDFICEKADQSLAIDYLFHVLDNEISYPIDDEKVKSLFSDDRMKKMKDLMIEQLQDEEVEVSDESSDEDSDE